MLPPDKPYFRGKVYYVTGEPVKNAEIEIYDIDPNLGRADDDRLLSKTTNNSGAFEGRAVKKWRDAQVDGLMASASAALDIPIFELNIKGENPGEELKAPFGYLGDNIEVPILTPWMPPTVSAAAGNLVDSIVSIDLGAAIVGLVHGPVMTINDTVINSNDSAAKVWDEIKNLVERGDTVEITFNGSLAALYNPILSMDYDELREFVCDKIGIDKSSTFMTVNPAVETLTAICIIAAILFIASPLALAIGFFGVCCGLAILLGVILGYRIEIKDTTTVGGPDRVPIPLSDRVIVLIPPNTATASTSRVRRR